MNRKPNVIEVGGVKSLDVSHQHALVYLVEQHGPLNGDAARRLFGDEFPEVEPPKAIFQTLLSQAHACGLIKRQCRGVYVGNHAP